MRRWFRTLQAQLLLWAVLPLTFALLAVAFTGVYAHQRAMRDFVAERDLALARMAARIVEDGLAHGTIGPDGSGLTAWLPIFLSGGTWPTRLFVMDERAQVLFHSDPALTGADFSGLADWTAALSGAEGSVLSQRDEGVVLSAFSPVRGARWVVVVEEPVEGLLGPILRLPALAPVVAGGAGLLSLLVLTFGWTTIVRPLRSLAQAAEQVSWGDDSAIARPVGGVQEVQDLHQALAEMVDRLRSYEAGIRDYLGAVTSGQEAERARLARELHDGPVQDLIALAQQAEMAYRLITRGELEPARVQLEQLQRATHRVVEELRRLIAALRPPYIEDLGLLSALETLVRQAAETTEATVCLVPEGEIRRCSPDVELAAYRIAQEALNNALRHARARTITIQVRQDANHLILIVTDDGIGFVLPPRPDLLTAQGRFGLMGMQERATRLGGRLIVETAPGKGTRLTAVLPLHGADLISTAASE
ncbi:MAG: histidine kinase [Anaerolineae bacterium]|nr:histidine kinase [Anaerolineae bacterium]